MVKNSSLRNSTSNLSLRPKFSVRVSNDEVPISSTSTPDIISQMSSNKPMPTCADVASPIYGPHYVSPFWQQVIPVAPSSVEQSSSNSSSTAPTLASDITPKIPSNKPVPTFADSPRLLYTPQYLFGPPSTQAGPSYPSPHALPISFALEEPKLPEALDDGWFEQKIKKLLDTKLELARARLADTASWPFQGQNAMPTIEGSAAKSKDEQKQEEKEEPVIKCPTKLAEEYTQPFCEFLTENPTVFHAIDYFKRKLKANGFKELSERSTWTSSIKNGGKYFVERNGSSLIAFAIGEDYDYGNGIAMIAGHVDALTARLKPVSAKKTTAGYVQLGIAPYAGALNSTWWDRDLGIGGRVLVKDSKGAKITSRLVKLGWPIARIPTLAPHFGIGMLGNENRETQTVPIIGLDNSDIQKTDDNENWRNLTLGGAGTFAATQPPKLVRAIAGELQIQDYSSIVNWELELYDIQPAQVGGLDKEFIFGGRIDDKLCSWAAMEALLASNDSKSSGLIKLVGVFDDEEIGSLLRQGARGNFLPSTIERICEAWYDGPNRANIINQTYANSFLVSADVTHAVNPNFLSSYLENHAPRLNVGLVITADSNGHMTTDSMSTALLTRIAEKSGNELQLFMIRNDSRSGGTVGPMLSSAMGVRAIDAGIPQLSMHSIRATTGSLDPGLGVKMFTAFFDHFEEVDGEFV